MSDTKKVLDEVYAELGEYSKPYIVDQKRFLISLDLLHRHQLIQGKHILDLGCGIGIMALALSKMGANVTGVDSFIFPQAVDNPYKVSRIEALQEIWKKNGISVLDHDILKPLPFREGEFDVVTSDATIEHILHSPKGLFASIHRVLKKDGAFLVSTPNLTNLLRRIRFLFGLSPNWDIRDYFNDESNFTGHRREFTVRELRQMLALSSFDVVQVITANVFLRPKRLLSLRKGVGQIFSILSLPFPGMREMIYILAKRS